VKFLTWMRARFMRLPRKTQWMQPLAGGLLVGIMGWFVPQTLGVGYGYVGNALNGGMVLKLMLLLLLLKFFAVTTAYASGNAGGIFGPALFLGAMLGGSLGTLAHGFWPGHVATSGVYALVGMGTAFAGIVRAPMTSVVMIFETTRDYAVIVPLMISNLVSFFISSQMQPEPIYEVLAHQDGIHLPTGDDREMEGMRRVMRAMRSPDKVLPCGMSVKDALEEVKNSVVHTWPVTDKPGIVGLVTRAMLEKAAGDGGGAGTLEGFLTDPDFPHLHSDQPLSVALDRLGSSHFDALPVVSRADLHRLEGIVTLQDVLNLYGFGGVVGEK
jgi:CIC family chloride channel protein